MKTNANPEPHAVIWIFVIVLSAFGSVSVAAMLGWIPMSTSGQTEPGTRKTPAYAPFTDSWGTNLTLPTSI